MLHRLKAGGGAMYTECSGCNAIGSEDEDTTGGGGAGGETTGGEGLLYVR